MLKLPDILTSHLRDLHMATSDIVTGHVLSNGGRTPAHTPTSVTKSSHLPALRIRWAKTPIQKTLVPSDTQGGKG